MATFLAGQRSSVVFAAALFFGSGALVGAVLDNTGPWGRLELSFIALALLFAVRAVWLVRRIANSVERTLASWAPREVRDAFENISSRPNDR